MPGEGQLAGPAGLQLDGETHNEENQAVSKQDDDLIGTKELLKQSHGTRRPPSVLAILPQVRLYYDCTIVGRPVPSAPDAPSRSRRHKERAVWVDISYRPWP